MATFLLGSVDNPSNLNDLELICTERFQLTPDVQINLDERLTAAFKTLYLPSCWNMMGANPNGADRAERLLHFSAKLGLTQLSTHFLTLPGSKATLSALNHEGLLPEDLARNVGFHDLANLLQYYRKQNSASHVTKPFIFETKDSISTPLVISTNVNWNHRDLEYDISELEKIKVDSTNKILRKVIKSEDMKELHLSNNDGSESEALNNHKKEDEVLNNFELSSLSRPSPRLQVRVLEDNLRRLRDIHEGIQKLRELNTKQIAVHQSPKTGPPRLSNSCPALYLTSVLIGEDDHFQNVDVISMRSIHQRRTSLSSNSHSLDSTFYDSINVKIHINDITPSVSQECLHTTSPVSEGEPSHTHKFLSNGVNHYKTANIGGTTSERLAKKSNKKAPVRRQSWSSLGAGVSPEIADEKQAIQRRWSLSSLDSDAEEAFSEASECFQVLPQGFTPSSSSGFVTKSYNSCQSSSKTPEISKEKLRTLSSGSCEESFLSKSAKQSSSVPSMRDIAADIKENVEPEKTHSTGSLSSTAKNFLVSFRSHPLQKSLSTPTITVDELPEKAKQDTLNRQSLCTMHPLPLHDVNDTLSHEPMEANKSMTYQHISLAGVLREGQLHPATADSDEEKPFSKRKKRSSIFFKKKPDKHKSKEGKKSAHQFTSYQGSPVACDACLKPFLKKQALKCENCLVVVHDSSCKDQVLDCNKFKLQMAQTKPSNLPVCKDSFAVPAPVNAAVQNKSAVQPQQTVATFQSYHSQTSIPMLCDAASRSSFINLGKMISEERDSEGGCELTSNITETNSASMESLDEGALEISDLEDNQFLRLTDDEAETWISYVDKKVVKKLKEREVKRQEAIYELIITEKHHCLTLQIMQKVYAQGMIKELNMRSDIVDRLLPCLGELLDLHKSFLCKLRERQSESQIVENIADVLEEQFHDQRAEQMTYAYGHFCSQHIEALNLYKDMSKSDRKFQNFIKKCSLKRLCKTRGIPECLLLVTQRITKYILVIESLIKSAKESKEEQQTLIKVLNNLKEIISQVDVQVAEKEKEIRLLEIYNRIDPKSTIFFRGKKFKKSDLLASNRKLRREGPLTWRSPRGKTNDVLAVMLSDLIFFLQENNQKYCFASLENKPGIVSLQKLLVRKKAGQDSRGMYLISSNPNEPEMMELFCRTAKEQKAWMEAVREAVEHCPDEDEGVPSETEEERKLEAARGARVRELMGLLHEKDSDLTKLCAERMRLLIDMLEVVGIESEQYENVKYSHLIENDHGPETKELIASAVCNASRLANSLYTSGTNLSRSVSSAGEHQSETYVSPLLPKRAETFGGFDNPSKDQGIPNKVPVLKKKLSLLKEHGDILPSKVKLDAVELGESLESAVRSFDSRTRSVSRPSSICGSPDKQHHRKFMAPNISPQNSFPSYKEIVKKQEISELLKLTATPLLLSQGKEQLVQIVELAHHLNTVVCTVSHLSSTVESLKVQVAQANDKISKLTKEKEVRDRRPLYRPEHQLEELRNLQKQLNHDRAIWQQEKTQHETDVNNQREELERLQEQLKMEQVDVTHQRELLYRKLDALQKQGIILSPSHTVVNLNNCNSRDVDSHKDDCRNTNPFGEISTASVSDFSQHRRTFSYDLHHDNRGEQFGSVPFGCNTAPLVHRQDSKGRPLLSSSSISSCGKVVPLHLCSSATNLQKRQSVSAQSVKQQLPLKLANTSAANGMFIQVSQGPQQVLPLKLALGSLPSSIPSLVNNVVSKNSTPKRSHSAASSPSSTLTAPVHVRGGSSPALVQTTFPHSISPNFNKPENSVLHQLKLTTEKTKNKKDRESNEEIFC